MGSQWGKRGKALNKRKSPSDTPCNRSRYVARETCSSCEEWKEKDQSQNKQQITGKEGGESPKGNLARRAEGPSFSSRKIEDMLVIVTSWDKDQWGANEEKEKNYLVGCAPRLPHGTQSGSRKIVRIEDT